MNNSSETLKNSRERLRLKATDPAFAVDHLRKRARSSRRSSPGQPAANHCGSIRNCRNALAEGGPGSLRFQLHSAPPKPPANPAGALPQASGARPSAIILRSATSTRRYSASLQFRYFSYCRILQGNRIRLIIRADNPVGDDDHPLKREKLCEE